MASNSVRAKRRIERWKSFKTNKGQWLSHWEDLARLMLPRRLGFITQMTEGERRTEEIYDGTPMRSARGLANAVGQLLRPEGEKFFFIRAEDDRLNSSDEVQDWLKRSEDKLLNSIYNPKARFRQAAGEADMDLVVFGTAVNFVGLSRKARRLKFLTIDLKDVDIALDEEGNPDTVFQFRRFTLRQAEQRFTKAKLSEDLRRRIENKSDTDLDTKYDFLRVVEPRANGKANAVLAKNMLFTNDWIEIASAHEVSEGGFREFPFIIPRWDTSSGEVYGRSPGMIALPDSETVNAMSETILVAGQKAADPPFFAPNDSSFDAINSFSGGISYYDVDTAVQLRGNPFFSMRNDYNLPITRDMQLDVRLQIEAAFFKNVFNLPIRGPEMTATEVITRKEEFIREMGATFGRLESDYLAPQVETAFSLLLRAGEFDPIPEILLDLNVRFEYTSPIKRIREQAEAAATRLWVQELMELQPIKPEIMDLANLDEVARHAARALDLPVGVVTSQDDVEEIRTERAEVESAALEQERLVQEAEVSATSSKTIKDLSTAMGGAPIEAPQ